MAFLRSLRETGGKPTIQAVGAQRVGSTLRVAVMVIRTPVRAGRVRASLETPTGSQRVTLTSPGWEPGEYQRSTLEVAS
jgi:hypothetical protein